MTRTEAVLALATVLGQAASLPRVKLRFGKYNDLRTAAEDPHLEERLYIEMAKSDLVARIQSL
jgi:hypothetical protein